MDSAYLKQTVGSAVSAALTDLVLHGHTQTHPNLSINPETNPLSTSQDPVSYVARYLLNHSASIDASKNDDKAQEKVRSLIDKIRAQELKKRVDEANRIREQQEALEKEQFAATAAKEEEERLKNPPPAPAEPVEVAEAVEAVPAPVESVPQDEPAEAPKEEPQQPPAEDTAE